jgi:hypothetical protein
VYICVFEKLYALLASVSRTQLITSWVENRLLAYVKVSIFIQFQIHPPLNILTVPNWLTVQIPLLPNRINSQNFKYYVSIGSLT